MQDISTKKEIAGWWASNPMTYGDQHGQAAYADGHQEFGSKEFFEQVDRVFYSWNLPLHTPEAKFGKIFPYQAFRNRKVLEVGCGMGTMAMNWALNGALVTAVDLNPVAIQQTQHRFELLGLHGTIRQADGNVLPFDDACFDYVYSWGVLHHSPNLEASIGQLMRVLKPGGQFGVMLYGRHSFLYWLDICFREGFLHGESLFLNPLQLASRYSDGAQQEGNPHTWPIIQDEAKRMFSAYTADLKIQVFGTDLDYELAQNAPLPGLNRWFPLGWKKALARRFGWSLWMSGSKVSG